MKNQQAAAMTPQELTTLLRANGLGVAAVIIDRLIAENAALKDPTSAYAAGESKIVDLLGAANKRIDRLATDLEAAGEALAVTKDTLLEAKRELFSCAMREPDDFLRRNLNDCVNRCAHTLATSLEAEDHARENAEKAALFDYLATLSTTTINETRSSGGEEAWIVRQDHPNESFVDAVRRELAASARIEKPNVSESDKKAADNAEKAALLDWYEKKVTGDGEFPWVRVHKNLSICGANAGAKDAFPSLVEALKDMKAKLGE